MPVLVNSSTGLAESLEQEQADHALQAGTHQIPLNDPQGNPVTAPLGQAQSLLSQGYSQPHPDQLNSLMDHAKYSATPEQIKTAVEGAAEAASFGASTAAETELGVDPTDIQKRRATNPGVHNIGQIAGLGLSSLVPGIGEANVLRSAGEAAAQAVGLGLKGSGFASQVGAGVLRGAAEMALFQSGDEVSKYISNDPQQSAESALANIGLMGLIGSVPGAALGAVSPLWEKATQTKTGQFLQDFKSRIQEHLDNPEPLEAISKELQGYHGEITGAADDVYGAKGLKAQELEKLMPEMSEAINKQPQLISNEINQTVKKMREKPSIYGDRYPSVLQSIDDDFQRATSNLEKPSDLFNATNEIKQKLGQYSDFRGRVTPDNPSYNAVKEMNQLYGKIKSTLENPEVWGKAAERQQAINQAFGEFKPALEDFQKKFMTEVNGERVIDNGKINTYVNQLGKPNAEIKQQMLQNFLDAAEKYKGVIGDTHSNLGLESPFTHTSLNVTRGTLKDLGSGAKLADVFIKRGLAKLSGRALGAGIGGSVGHTAGAPWLGAILGEQALGPFFESILPSLVKPILKNLPSAEGFQSAVQFGLAVTKGEAALNRSATALFKPSSYVTPQRIPANENKKTERLDKSLKNLQMNTASLMNVGGSTGHYLPDHQTALAATAARATQYLNSIRPSEVRGGPLDPPREPSLVAKAQFNRALSIAENPLHVLERIREGTLVPRDVIALKSIYPALYDRMSQKLTEKMIEHVSKGNAVPYKTRLGLSLFLGQPLDSSLKSSSIAAVQATYAVPLQAPSQGQAPGKKHGSMKALSKLSQSYTTTSQAHELEQINARTS